ncbi:MAG: PHP domain-containing protein [Oscillospiraceae bacterium]|nr:PHP domain-containing protein [Oscillospiraceae bacterium]
MKYYDFHIHSNQSDGTDSPEQIARLCTSQEGATTFALTDHDTINGCLSAAKAMQGTGACFIPGIEISAKTPETENGKLHILGYGIDPTSSLLMEVFEDVSRSRIQTAKEICDILCKNQMMVSFEEVQAYAQDSSCIGKPHIAAILMQKGYCKSMDEIFGSIFQMPQIKQVKKRKLDAEFAFELIKKAGGVPVMAHPFQTRLTGNALRDLVAYLKGIGLVGIEAYYPKHTETQFQTCMHLAEEFHLLPSIGSDYHGNHKPGVALFTGKDNSLLSLRARKEYDGQLADVIRRYCTTYQ